MTELLPCPFCGGEAEVYEMRYGADGQYSVFGVFCVDDSNSELIGLSRYQHAHFIDNFPTEAEAIEAWNTRAAMEFDNWFYLPKPKEPIVEVTGTMHAWDGTKVKTDVFYQVQEQAVINWAKELDEHIIKRICEVWNSRAERTCEMETDHDELEVIAYSHEDTWAYKCSACDWSFRYDRGIKPNYCPNCGAKVVGE